ncbi:hypothetical protein K438DRAFT_1812865 [Mycena galopus ATCC 62051]|nr:hypothetical protein K438DRAFT_1812865 [Mycena galopus ATCC 62051]
MSSLLSRPIASPPFVPMTSMLPQTPTGMPPSSPTISQRFNPVLFVVSVGALVFANLLVDPYIPTSNMTWILFFFRIFFSVFAIIGYTGDMSSFFYSLLLVFHEAVWIASAQEKEEGSEVLAAASGALLGLLAFYAAIVALNPKDLEERMGVLGLLFRVPLRQNGEPQLTCEDSSAEKQPSLILV